MSLSIGEWQCNVGWLNVILIKDRRFWKFILRSSKYGQPPTPPRIGSIIDSITEMSIYPFSSTNPRLGIQTTLSPARFSIFSGDSDAFLGKIRCAILPASSDSILRSPPSWKSFVVRSPAGIRIRCPSQLSWHLSESERKDAAAILPLVSLFLSVTSQSSWPPVRDGIFISRSILTKTCEQDPNIL